jgi:hypothetical protein
MLLSLWRADATHAAAMTPKVEALLGPALIDLGALADPDCWITWGDDPSRWSMLVPTPAGLATIHVRVMVPQEGPRVAGKLVRWNRVQIGDYSIESHSGHRILSFQIEGLVLHAADEECERMAEFIAVLLAALDGRPAPG